MRQIEYIYMDDNGIVNVVQCKVSQNSKIGIGYIMQTYHFSINQINDMSLFNDKKTCLDCPLSFNMNEGKSGGCYTHKGMQRMGLNSMLKRLSKMFTADIFGELRYNEADFNSFISKVKNIYPLDLIRFGAYGEPVHLGKHVVSELSKLCPKTTGYTHQYKKPKYMWAKNYFMSSVHNENDLKVSDAFGFRAFIAKDSTFIVEGVNCPASKESDLNLSCIKCGLCNGNKSGIRKNVYINKH